MPLYDCVLLLKPKVVKEDQMDLLKRIGLQVIRRNGVVMDMKSFGNVHLGYGIKKLRERYYQGRLLQMTMMATPNINKELHYLNKEDRLLRWLLVKHRETEYGPSFGTMGDRRESIVINFANANSHFGMREDEDEDEDEGEDTDEEEEEEEEEHETEELKS